MRRIFRAGAVALFLSLATLTVGCGGTTGTDKMGSGDKMGGDKMSSAKDKMGGDKMN